MSSNRNLEVTIREYLLGQLSDDGLEQFEQRLFADDDLFEEVLVAEDELIDESLAGELKQNESELFAKNFLNSRDREQKLIFRRALKSYVKGKNKQAERKPAPQPWIFRLFENWSPRSAATIAALVVIVGIAVVVPFVRDRFAQPPTFTIINLTIGPSERAPDTQVTKVKFPLAVAELRPRLALPEPSIPDQSYRVELVRVSGINKTLKIVARDENSIVVVIPASQLELGQYALNLYVTKPGEPERRIAGSYYFTVE